MNIVKGIHTRGEEAKEGTTSAWGSECRGRLHRELSNGYLREKEEAFFFVWLVEGYFVFKRHSFLCVCFGRLGFVVIAEKHLSKHTKEKLGILGGLEPGQKHGDGRNDVEEHQSSEND